MVLALDKHATNHYFLNRLDTRHSQSQAHVVRRDGGQGPRDEGVQVREVQLVDRGGGGRRVIGHADRGRCEVQCSKETQGMKHKEGNTRKETQTVESMRADRFDWS